MKPLSGAKLKQIKHLLDGDLSIRDIAKQSRVSIGKVHSIKKSCHNNRSGGKTGRPRKMSAADDRFAIRLIQTGQQPDAVAVASQLSACGDISISSQTVRRHLKESGMKAVVKKKKPALNARHRRARLAFANQYKEWTEDDWRRVIWSDETKINRLGSDGRKWAWKNREKA